MKETASGELTNGTTTFDIVTLDRVAGGPTLPAPVGFRFAQGDDTLAAVSMLGEPTVMLGGTAPGQKSLIAAAASAILLTADQD